MTNRPAWWPSAAQKERADRACSEVMERRTKPCGCDPLGTHHCLDLHEPLAGPGSESMLDRAMRDA